MDSHGEVIQPSFLKNLQIGHLHLTKLTRTTNKCQALSNDLQDVSALPVISPWKASKAPPLTSSKVFSKILFNPRATPQMPALQCRSFVSAMSRSPFLGEDSTNEQKCRTLLTICRCIPSQTHQGPCDTYLDPKALDQQHVPHLPERTARNRLNQYTCTPRQPLTDVS